MAFATAQVSTDTRRGVPGAARLGGTRILDPPSPDCFLWTWGTTLPSSNVPSALQGVSRPQLVGSLVELAVFLGVAVPCCDMPWLEPLNFVQMHQLRQPSSVNS